MTDHAKRALLDLKAHQQSGDGHLCQRTNVIKMKMWAALLQKR